ncbi:hypothetical protein GCM10023238_06100 [Streptomyces heliomycini]
MRVADDLEVETRARQFELASDPVEMSYQADRLADPVVLQVREPAGTERCTTAPAARAPTATAPQPSFDPAVSAVKASLQGKSLDADEHVMPPVFRREIRRKPRYGRVIRAGRSSRLLPWHCSRSARRGAADGQTSR